MTLTEFFLKYNKKFLDFDGTNGYQCVDVIKAYFQEVLGLPPFRGNAIDYWTDIPGFRKIGKKWFNRPEPGDIVVWNTNINPYGHVAICNWSRLFDFGGFEQNYPVGTPCHYQDHTYKNVLGWLRPQPIEILPVLPKSPLKIARIGVKLPPAEEFASEVIKYSGGKISLVCVDFFTDVKKDVGMLTQDEAYTLVDRLDIKESFVFIFYQPNTTSAFYATYYYPKRNCCITTCPGTDSRLLAYELVHQLQYFYNTNRGGRAPVQVIDNWPPSDELIKSKYDSVSWFYN